MVTFFYFCVCAKTETFNPVNHRSIENDDNKGKCFILKIEDNIHISYNIFNHISMIYDYFYYYLNVFIIYFFFAKVWYQAIVVWYQAIVVWYQAQKSGTKLLYKRGL